jgi:hypothetical protein
VRVPVFLGVGERDITGPPHEIPASFPASPDITLYVQPGASHSHFAFPTCHALFERAGTFVEKLTCSSPPPPSPLRNNSTSQ